jgi:transcriptional regulator with XRE-family HTH domain
MQLEVFLKRRDLTQQALADALDIPRNTVWRWINKKATPSAEMLQKLADFFNVSVDELLNGPAPNEIKFTIIWEVDKEMNGIDVKMNEFKIGRGEDDDFGMFRFSKDTDIEEIGRQFMNHLRAARTSRETYDETLKKLEG